MLQKINLFIPLLILSVFLMFLGAGCATTPRQGGAKLSEAADQAAKEPEDQEPIRQPSYHDPDEVEKDEELLIDIPETSTRSTSMSTGDVKKKPAEDRRGIDFGLFYTNPSGNQSDGFHGVHLRYSARPQSRIRASGGLYFGDHTKGTMSGHADGISSPIEFGLDVVGRFYLTKDHTFMGLYGLAGFRWGFMTFSFTNPITVIEGGDSRKIKSDKLQIYTLYAGTGITLIQTRHVHIGAGITGGVRLGNGVTQEGFDNDLFPTVGYIQFALETSLIAW